MHLLSFLLVSQIDCFLYTQNTCNQVQTSFFPKRNYKGQKMYTNTRYELCDFISLIYNKYALKKLISNQVTDDPTAISSNSYFETKR